MLMFSASLVVRLGVCADVRFLVFTVAILAQGTNRGDALCAALLLNRGVSNLGEVMFSFILLACSSLLFFCIACKFVFFFSSRSVARCTRYARRAMKTWFWDRIEKQFASFFSFRRVWSVCRCV